MSYAPRCYVDIYILWVLNYALVKLHPICKKASFFSVFVVTWRFLSISFIWWGNITPFAKLFIRICLGKQIHINLRYSKHKGMWDRNWRLTSFLWHWWLAQGRMGTRFWLAPRWLRGHLTACKIQRGRREGEPSALILQLYTTKTQLHLFNLYCHRRHGPHTEKDIAQRHSYFTLFFLLCKTKRKHA